MDVPWSYNGGSESYNSEGNRGQVNYPTMNIEEIKNLNIPMKMIVFFGFGLQINIFFIARIFLKVGVLK